MADRYGIHVSVVDDDRAVRESLKLLIQMQGIDVRTYESCLEFLEEKDYLNCCCLVLDVRLPGISGLQLQKKLALMKNVPPIIFISGHADVPMAVQAMRDGAIDFLQKPFPEQILLDRIALAVESYSQQQHKRIQQATMEARFALLTGREKDVLQAVCAGSTNKQVADNLSISIKTVEQHRAKMMEKLRVNSVAELVQLIETKRRLESGSERNV
jgi:two-component system response regulator FixJ